MTGIDYNNKNVSIEGKDSLSYDKLLIATGVSNRIPPIEGLNTVPFFTLRNKQDYNKINEALRAPGVKNVTIIGGGFIGMETPSAIKLAFKDANVTVLEGQNAPLTHVLGEKVGTVLQRLSEKNGVKIITNAKISSIQSEGTGSQVNLVGSTVPADVLIVATGVQAETSVAPGLETAEGGIKTNAFL